MLQKLVLDTVKYIKRYKSMNGTAATYSETHRQCVSRSHIGLSLFVLIRNKFQLLEHRLSRYWAHKNTRHSHAIKYHMQP